MTVSEVENTAPLNITSHEDLVKEFDPLGDIHHEDFSDDLFNESLLRDCVTNDNTTNTLHETSQTVHDEVNDCEESLN